MLVDFSLAAAGCEHIPPRVGAEQDGDFLLGMGVQEGLRRRGPLSQLGKAVDLV